MHQPCFVDDCLESASYLCVPQVRRVWPPVHESSPECLQSPFPVLLLAYNDQQFDCLMRLLSMMQECHCLELEVSLPEVFAVFLDCECFAIL